MNNITGLIKYIAAAVLAISLIPAGGIFTSAFNSYGFTLGVSIVVYADDNEKIPEDYDYENETPEEAYRRGAFFAGNPEHLVFATPVEFGNSTPVRMLWLGNSIINRYELAWQFANLCDANGIKLDVKVYAEDEFSLQEHRNGQDEQDDLRNGNFDIVMMQEESHEIRWDPDYTAQIVREMMDMAPEKTQFFLYETMSYSGQSENQPMIHDLYTQVAEQTGAEVLYIGDQFQEVIKANPDEIAYDNLQHPSRFGYGEIIKLLYENLKDVLRKRYGELNPGSMTLKDYGMENQQNMGGALYIVRNSANEEVGAFLTDSDGTGYVAEKSRSGEENTLYFKDNGSHVRRHKGFTYTRTQEQELSLPSMDIYTVDQARAAGSGAYINEGPQISGRSYKVDEREITPVMHWAQINEDYLQLDKYSITLNLHEFAAIQPICPDEGEFTFTSSDSNVLYVSEDGIIVPLSCGNCNVTVTAANGIEKNCMVRIIAPISLHAAWE